MGDSEDLKLRGSRCVGVFGTAANTVTTGLGLAVCPNKRHQAHMQGREEGIQASVVWCRGGGQSGKRGVVAGEAGKHGVVEGDTHFDDESVSFSCAAVVFCTRAVASVCSIECE